MPVPLSDVPRSVCVSVPGQLLWAYKVKGDVAGAERTLRELRGEHGLEPDPITYHALLALYSQVTTGGAREPWVMCDVIRRDHG